MRITIKVRRPAFSTIFKTCALCLLGYVLAVFSIVGLAALFGKLRIDPNLRPADFLIGFMLGPTLVPLVFGLMLAVPGWALWALYSRFRKSTIVLHVESLADVEAAPRVRKAK